MAGFQVSEVAALLGTNISPKKKSTFESMIFLFPFGGICDRSLEGKPVKNVQNHLQICL